MGVTLPTTRVRCRLSLLDIEFLLVRGPIRQLIYVVPTNDSLNHTLELNTRAWTYYNAAPQLCFYQCQSDFGSQNGYFS